MAEVTFNVVVNEESDGTYWAEVKELPGCFASGFSMAELQEAVFEAMQLWLPDGIKLDDPKWKHVEDDDERKPRGKRPAGGKPPAKPRRKNMLVCA